MAKNFEQIPTPNDNEPENPGRRKFLKKALTTGVKAGIGAGISAKVISMLEEEKKKGSSDDLSALREKLHEQEGRLNDVESREGVPVVLSPIEQLEAWGEVRDMQAGVEAIADNHYRKLIATEKGRADLRAMAQNISRLNMHKIAQPYRGLGLSDELAYMIALQETRARNLTSHAGAKGMTGLMPATIEAMGFEQTDAHDPYKANVMTAHYLATERDERFGDDTDLLLHAYNAGGGLFGYTATEPNKESRNAEGFYNYMQDYFNEQFEKIKTTIEESGYFSYTIGRGDKTLSHIARTFNVPLRDLLEVNSFSNTTIIHRGDEIRIPCGDPMVAAKYLLRKPLEAIRYAPEVKAKYKALAEEGYTRQFELAMRDD